MYEAPSEADASAVRANRWATERAMIPAVEPSSSESGSCSFPPSAAVVAANADAEAEAEGDDTTGGAASPSFPHIVYIFPDPVCPYASTVTA